MQKDPNKVKALEAAIAQIEKNYGQGSIMKLGDTRHMQVESVPTGSLSLDLALGVGGIPIMERRSDRAVRMRRSI